MSLPSPGNEDVLPPTPPQDDNHGVRLSEVQIKSLVRDGLQDREVDTIDQLPSGKTWNNCIYFISLKLNSSYLGEPLGNSIVLKVPGTLKVPGWNFGVDKLQNEVICLLLLEKHCPTVPVPRVLAWHEGDSCVRRVQRIDGSVSIAADKITEVSEHSHMWILMTGLSGQTIQTDGIDPQSFDGLMQQLANYVSQWRAIPPPAPGLGNLRFVADNKVDSEGVCNDVFGLKVAFYGLLIGVATSEMRNWQEYYRTKLRTELEILQNNDHSTPRLRATVGPIVEELLSDVLPKTALFRHGKSYHVDSIFTHYDVLPRNLLVSSNSTGQLSISGIIDLEFGGFFPPELEFLNMIVGVAGEGHWPKQTWALFSSHLQALGVDVPEGLVWKQACALLRIIENIAPWQLRLGDTIQGEELDAALKHAKSVIRDNVEILRQG